MRATVHVKWLLLTLGLLFHYALSDAQQSTPSAAPTSQNATAVSGGTILTRPAATSQASTGAAAGGATGAPTTSGAQGQASQPAQMTYSVPLVIKPADVTTVSVTTQPPTTPAVTHQPLNPAQSVTSTPQHSTTITQPQVSPATVPATAAPPKVTNPTAAPHSGGHAAGGGGSSSSSAPPTQPLTTLKAAAAPTTVTATPTAPTAPQTTPQMVGPITPTKTSRAASTPPQATVSPAITPQGTTAGHQIVTTKQNVKTTVPPASPALTTPKPSETPKTTGGPSAVSTAAPTTAQASGAASTALSPTPSAVVVTTVAIATTTSSTAAGSEPKHFSFALNDGQERDEDKDLVTVCRRLMVDMHVGNCTLMWRQHNGKVLIDEAEVNGKVKTSIANQIYEEITKKSGDNKTLIAILASCGALLIMIVILAVCASHHRKPYNENQQHLTEELHTVENGYHDNPTLEVMEVQPEMQEKKVALNGEFNDSWIVPMDNLLKEDMADEEDTHL